MSSSEPRLTSPDADAAPRSPSTNGGRGNGAAQDATGSVLVAQSVEQALMAVQQQLARQAATVVAPPAPRPPPPAVRAPAPPSSREIAPAPRRVRTPVRYAEQDDDQDDDAEFWGETRERATEQEIDPDKLSADEQRALGRLKARKVRRILRHVSPWSVFKVSIFFNLCLWLIMMFAGVILWRVAQLTPVLENIEKFYAKATGEKTFQLDGRAIFRAAAGAGVILVLTGTAFIVMMAILFNLIADLTGGIRMSVIELESTRRTVRRGRGAEQLRARAKRPDRPPPPVTPGEAARPAIESGGAVRSDEFVSSGPDES